ncbi:MAG: sigma-70 family RNA polymerase sigma factor [bacterium]|nr:sigma-70 family RNA polymerase sigma factor [bacterium]
MRMSTHTPDRDRPLVAAVLADGDEDAFRQLYRHHSPRLFNFLLRVLGGSRRDAEDVLQETWIRVVEKLGTFRGEAAFGTWLTGVGLNMARTHLRRLGRRDEVVVEEVPEAPVRPATHEEAIDLERAISLLPDGYRTVLVLHDVEGWRHREIAAALDISDGTSKSQLFAARKWMRSYLGQPAEKKVNHDER